MRAQAGLWPKAIAHNFGHYVTLPPDKTLRQRRDDTGLSGYHRTSRLRTARPWWCSRGVGRNHEGRSGEAEAEPERAQRGRNGKPMAAPCLRRSVRLARN